jgi:broad specificity phosphatase PhoE
MLRKLFVTALVLALWGCGHIGKPRVIYLARHGQTEWNRKARMQGDPDLDQVGYVNRLNLWLLLKNEPLHSIYTSERRRTQRTADLVARQHGLPVQTRASLNEIQPGVLEGICYSQLAPEKADPADRACEVRARGSRPEVTLRHARKILASAWRDRINGKIPLGGSFRELVEQATAFVDELERGLADRQVLVVGHGVINRALLHHLVGWPLAAVARLRQENDQVYRVEGVGTGQVRLSLYTPGVGWRRCQTMPPRRGQRHLDCHPRPTAPQPAQLAQPQPEQQPPPAPAADQAEDDLPMPPMPASRPTQ